MKQCRDEVTSPPHKDVPQEKSAITEYLQECAADGMGDDLLPISEKIRGVAEVDKSIGKKQQRDGNDGKCRTEKLILEHDTKGNKENKSNSNNDDEKPDIQEIEPSKLAHRAFPFAVDDGNLLKDKPFYDRVYQRQKKIVSEGVRQ